MIYILMEDHSYRKWILIACIVMLLVVCSYTIYSIYMYLHHYSIISGTIKNVYGRMQDVSRKRQQKNLAAMVERGSEKDNSIIGRIDRAITYSGIPSKYKWASTEVLLSLNIIAMIVITIAIYIIYRSVTVAIVAVTTLEIIIMIVLTYKANRKYIKVEDSLGEFMGCIENFSSTSDDIMVILDRCSKYIDTSIGAAVTRCVSEAKNSGNRVAAMARLESTFENKYWKLLIRNLSMCSRHSCNYTDVIKQLKDVIEEYTTYEKERRQEYRNNRMQIYAMLAIGGFSIVQTSSLIEGSWIEMITGNKLILLISVVGMIEVAYISIIKGMEH